MRLQGQVVAIKSGIKQSVNQPIYVFNAEDDKGFVVVSGDDRTDAILGYTLQGCYSEDDAPPALKEWMRQMTAEIEVCTAFPAVTASPFAFALTVRRVS